MDSSSNTPGPSLQGGNTTPIKSGFVPENSSPADPKPARLPKPPKPPPTNVVVSQGVQFLKGYSLTEDQMGNLATLGRTTTIYAGLTTFCFSQSFTCFYSYAFTDKLTNLQFIFLAVVLLVSIILGCVFGFLAKRDYDEEGRLIDKIKKNTKFHGE